MAYLTVVHAVMDFLHRSERMNRAAEKVLHTPTKTFVEVAIHTATSAPLDITNYGWMLLVPFWFIGLAFFMVPPLINLSANLAIKSLRERHMNHVMKFEEQIEFLENVCEEVNTERLNAINKRLEQDAKHEEAVISFGGERIAQGRAHIAMAEQHEPELTDQLEAKDQERADALRAAEDTYFANLRQKDADHLTELKTKDEQHSAQMKAQNDIHDRFLFNRQLVNGARERNFMHEIQVLESEKNSAKRRFDRLSNETHQRDAKIKDLEAEIVSSKHELRRQEHLHKMEMGSEQERGKARVKKAVDKAWARAEKVEQELESTWEHYRYELDRFQSETLSCQLVETKANLSVTRLTEQLEAKKLELAQSSEAKKGLEKELGDLRVSYTAKEQDTAQLNKAVEEKTQELAKKTKEWEDEKRRLSKPQWRQSRRSYVTPKAIEFEAETVEVQARATCSIDQHQRALAEVHAARKDLAAADAALADLPKLKNQLAKARERISVLGQTEAELMTTKIQLSQEASRWKTAHDGKVAELKKASGDLTMVKKSLIDAQVASTRANQVGLGLQEKYNELQASHDRVSSDKENADQKLKEANDEIEDLGKDINSLHEQLNSQEMEQSETTREFSEELEKEKWATALAEKELAEARAAIQNNDAVDYQRQLIGNLEQQLASERLERGQAEEELAEASTELQNNVEAVNHWVAENQKLEEKVNQLSMKLEKAVEGQGQPEMPRDQHTMCKTQLDRLRNAKEKLEAENFALQERLEKECTCKRLNDSSHGNPDASQGDTESNAEGSQNSEPPGGNEASRKAFQEQLEEQRVLYEEGERKKREQLKETIATRKIAVPKPRKRG